MFRVLSASLVLGLSVGAYVGCGGKVTVVEGGGGSGGGVDTGAGTGTGTSGGTNTGTVTSTGTHTGTVTSTGTNTGTVTSTGTGTGGPQECWQQPPDGCFNCCENNYGAEIEAINELFIDFCVCSPGAPCQADCNGFCNNGNPPNPPCEQCLEDIQNNQDECLFDAVDQCSFDPGCAPIIECWSGC